MATLLFLGCGGGGGSGGDEDGASSQAEIWNLEDFGGGVAPIVKSASNSFELNNAISAINSGGNYVVNITSDIQNFRGFSTPTFASTQNINVSIRGAKTISLATRGSAIYISSNQTIILRDLSLKGLSNNSEAVVTINGGNFIMKSGKISNNGSIAGGVAVLNGNFEMQGGEIRENIAGLGGGVYVDNGSFTMSGGTITKNSAIAGGGVFVVSSNGATFTKSNGVISANSANGEESDGAYGDQVYVVTGASKSNHKIREAAIDNNTQLNSAVNDGWSIGGAYEK
jgi:hypothetical protein